MKKGLLFLMLSALTLGAWADDTYTPLEWIDYTGNDVNSLTNYFDTGYKPVVSTKVEFKCLGYSGYTNRWRAIFSGRTGAGNGFSIYRNNGGNKFGYFVGGYTNDNVGSFSDNTDYRIIADFYSMEVNGINVQSTGKAAGNYVAQTTNNITLFSGTNDWPFYGRIYYFNIYEGNDLKHAFVPVLKNGTTPCFKCTVCNDYKEPQGSGFGYNQLTYTPVEYIEYPSNGAETPVSRTFDTGYVPNENTKVVTKFMANANGNWSAIFSGRNNEAGSGISLYKNSNNTKLGYFVGSYKNDNHADFSVGTIYTAVCKLDKLKLNGTDHTTNNPSWVATTRSITLFSNPEKDQIFRGRIYYFDIYEGDNLKHHFIPVKASDETVGFYDLVDRKYITTRTTTDSQYFTTSADNGGSDVSFYAYNGNSRFSEYGFYSNMFDGDLDTKWEAVSWIYYVYDDDTEDDFYSYYDDNGNALFAASEPIYVNGLTLYTAGDTKSYPNRNPYEWSLYGTNDVNVAFGGLGDIEHSGWEPIERVGRAQMPTENKTGKYYKFNPSQTAYKYFRFHVHRLVGKDELQLAELELDYSTEAKAPTTRIADGGNKSGYGEVAANIFDGPSSTKWYKETHDNWVVFKTPKPIYASSYIIQTANDESIRDPKTFQLYGALDAAPTTDGSTTGWTEIDSETDASSTIPTDRYAFAEFEIDEPGVYQYFLLKIDDSRSNYYALQLAEFIIDNDPAYVIISSDADMAEFASKVNSGSTSLNAILLADVNSSTSAGTTDNKYTGTFDGQGHVVTLSISTNTEFQGLIGCATGGAVIKNVITRGSVNGSARCGGILGGSQDSGAISIQNCGNEANITTTGKNAGGIHGCNNESKATYTLINCYNTGTVKGSDESAGLSGWLGNNATVTNCYNSGSVTGIDSSNRSFARWNNGTYTNCYNTLNAGEVEGRTDNYPMVKVRSGELCYKLNSDTNDGTTWTQTIGEDSHPIPFSTRQTVHQANTSSFTNLPVSAGVVQIDSADDLVKFSREVNNGNISMDADVVADIDMTGKGGSWWPIGGTDASDDTNTGDKAYTGTFDGKNHTIDNLVQDDNGNNNQGLFGVVNGGCVIKNLILGSGCHFKGLKYVGALAGSSRGAGWVTIQNCGNEGAVTASSSHAAAIIGCVVHNGPATRITDCYNKGNINGNAESAILTGWFGGHSSVEVNNFYNTGTISGDDGGQLYRNGAGITFNNVYHTSANQNATQIGEGWLTSGELCYKLGASFKQDLSQESYPIPFGTKAVSAGKWFNDTDNDVYYNKEGDDYTIYQLNMSDTQTEYNVPDDGTVTAKNVRIIRTIPADQWIGLCLPFDYDIPSGWDVRELDHVNGTGESASMIFTTASSIEAGKPYIVKPTSEVTSITATNKAIATAASTETDGGVTMIGNFAQTSITTGSYYINTSSQLKKLTATSANLKGFRAYFTVDSGSGVKALNFDLDDDATGISLMEDGRSQMEDGAIYNVAGQRLSKTQKGINIVNGKKIAVK